MVARMGPGAAGVKRHVVKAARAVHVTELQVIVGLAVDLDLFKTSVYQVRSNE